MEAPQQEADSSLRYEQETVVQSAVLQRTTVGKLEQGTEHPLAASLPAVDSTDFDHNQLAGNNPAVEKEVHLGRRGFVRS